MRSHPALTASGKRAKRINMVKSEEKIVVDYNFIARD